MERGASLLEFLIALGISSFVGLIVVSSYTYIVRENHYSAERVAAEAEANGFLQQVASELRTAGAGIPLYQPTFDPSAPLPGDVALPILPGASDTSLSFRTNLFGREALTIAPFTPETETTIELTSTGGLRPGDLVYLSGAVAGSDQALQAMIAEVSASTIRIEPNFIAQPGAVFPAGSSLSPVTTINYEQSPSGIIRDEGRGPSLSAPRVTITLRYLDQSGAPLPTPLSRADIIDKLAAVQISVRSTANIPSRDQRSATNELQEEIALRNLLLFREN